MSKVLSVRVDDSLAEWLDRTAVEKGTTRAALLEHALLQLRDIGARGLPELRGGTDQCACPVLEDGARGFSTHCPVHGGRSREEFAEAVADRSAMFRGLTEPASVKYGGEQ